MPPLAEWRHACGSHLPAGRGARHTRTASRPHRRAARAARRSARHREDPLGACFMSEPSAGAASAAFTPRRFRAVRAGSVPPELARSGRPARCDACTV